MRIAIIIGVSDYQREASLPACKRDADAIEALLTETGLFEHRLHLTDNLLAHSTKDQILSFLAKFRGQKVSQVLFYFSGHGTIEDGELLYLLSDFDEERPRQTSIENTEVDNWIRELAPEVAAKIVDCCHSGAPYIKEVTSMEAAIAKSKGKLNACYFIAASQADEVTYAGDPYSKFTEHILLALAQRNLGSIRYKDLIDAVLDSYKDNSSQRPYIVQQGSMTDIFFEQTEKTLTLLKSLVIPQNFTQPSVPEAAPAPEAVAERRRLAEIIAEDASSMLTSKAVTVFLADLQKSVERIELDEQLREIYEFQPEFSTAWSDSLVKEEVIGKWLRKNGGDLFAVAEEEEIRTRMPYHLLDPFEASIYPRGKVESKRDITGFTITTDLDYDLIKLRLNPKYPNIDKYEAAFLLLWSKRRLVLFTYSTQLQALSWSQYRVPEQVQWSIVWFPAKDLAQVNNFVISTFHEMASSAKDKITQRFMSQKTRTS